MSTVGLLIACDIVRGSEQRLSSEHNQQHTNTALLLLVLSNGTAARLQSQLDAVTTQQLPLNVSGRQWHMIRAPAVTHITSNACPEVRGKCKHHRPSLSPLHPLFVSPQLPPS
jgi:hypothetical protein